jgi:hypothetical protein
MQLPLVRKRNHAYNLQIGYSSFRKISLCLTVTPEELVSLVLILLSMSLNPLLY